MASMMYITVSSGVGGGWILHNQPWRGWEGMAGEIGHTVIDPNGRDCLCGKRGCLERLASGLYLAQDAREELEASPGSGAILRRLANGRLSQVNGQLLSQAAAEGDLLAQKYLDRSAEALGVAIGNSANLINPQLFVLGGGVTKAGEGWWQGVRAAARQTALPEIHFQIQPADLGDDAPLWGAVALALEGIQSPGQA
jgi:glucokinase